MSPNENFKSENLVMGKATDLADFALAKRLTDVLMQHYPGYMWGVHASSEHGMVSIRNFSLSGEWGYMLHIARVFEDVEDKLTIQAGGEILERFRAHRGAMRQEEIDGLQHDFMGRTIVDATGAQNV